MSGYSKHGVKKGLWGLTVVIVALAVILVFNLYALLASKPKSIPHGSIYEGMVLEDVLPKGKYNGTVLSQLGCNSLGKGLWVNCTVLISIGNFNSPVKVSYEHDMAVKPCLRPGIMLDITVSNGRVLMVVVGQDEG